MNNYVCYHCHSDYSLLDSCTKFNEYADMALNCGMSAIASTEHGLPRGWIEKKLYCDKIGIKFIHGLEIYLTADEIGSENRERDNYHTVLLAKNQAGVDELNSLVELSSRKDHSYYTNRITFDEFLGISDNIIKISACLASPLNKYDRSSEMYNRIANHYDYFEIQHHNTPDQIEYNKYLFRLSQRLGKPLIAGTDTHSASAYKAKCRDILMEYKEQHYEGENGFDLVWKNYDELVAAYEAQDALPRWAYMQAIENTNIMADSVEPFTLDTSIKYPILYGSPEKDAERLVETTWRMLDEKLEAGIIPRSQEQAFRAACQEELDVFEKIGMMGFIMSMSELICWCKANDIPIGPARGSVAGSRVAFVTGIIDVNPETWNTVFSRFANSSRVEPGDIDIDCIESDRPRIFEHIISRFGEKYTARVASYGTIADLAFIDDCGGGLAIMWEREHNPEKFNERGRMNKTKYGFDSKNPYRPARLAEIKAAYKQDADAAKAKYPDLFQYFDGMVGTKVSQSVHPAGMVISPVPLDNFLGVFHKDGERCLCANMDEAHDVGAIKYDFLVLKTVGVIRDTCKLAGIKYPSMHEIDFNDSAVWKDIASNPAMVFQFESEFAATSLRQYNPKSIYDMSLVTAAIRPSGQSYRDDLLRHKHHDNPSPQIEKLLANNNGYLVYQEDIIAFLQQVCGLSGSDADSVRRGIAKKKMELLEEWMPVILDGYCSRSARPRNIAEEECKEFLKIIEDASSYMFG